MERKDAIKAVNSGDAIMAFQAGLSGHCRWTK